MKKAFSLIELVIVLIIIGILMTFVMKGSSIVKDAKIKKDFANYILRLKDDIYKYEDWALSSKGYAAIIGDGKENGGFEDTTDGFVDTDEGTTFNSTISDLLGSSLPSNVHVLTSYDGTQKPYKPETNHVTDYLKIVDKDIDKVFKIGKGDEGYIYFSALGKEVHLYLGKDQYSSNPTNAIIIFNPDLQEAISYDTMVDGIMNGEDGKLVLLGYKYSSSCSPKSTDNCKCNSGICIAKNLTQGCPYPSCKSEEVKNVILGLILE